MNRLFQFRFRRRWMSITVPVAVVLGLLVTPVRAQELIAPSTAPENPGDSLPQPETTSTGSIDTGSLDLESIINGDLESIVDVDAIMDDVLGDIGLDDLGLDDLGLEDILGDAGLEDILGDAGLEDILSDAGLEDILDIDSVMDDILGDIGLDDLGLEDILGDAGLEDILDIDSVMDDILGDIGLDDIFGSDDVLDDAIEDVLVDGGFEEIEDALLGDLGDLGLGGIEDVFGGGGDSYSADVNIAMPPLGESLTAWSTLAGSASSALVGNVVSTFGSAPAIITGALGVPDVLASQLSVNDTVMGGVENGSPTGVSQQVDRFNVNPVALSDTIGKELSRAASVGFSNTLLSEAGQQAIVEEVQATDETLTEIVDLATEAQDLDVTQDVMKNMSAMLAQQSSIEVAEYGQTIQLRQQFAADAVVQAEAAEELAAMSRRSQTEPMAAAAEVIQSSSTLLLF